jgi:hypothetical protein
MAAGSDSVEAMDIAAALASVVVLAWPVAGSDAVVSRSEDTDSVAAGVDLAAAHAASRAESASTVVEAEASTVVVVVGMAADTANCFTTMCWNGCLFGSRFKFKSRAVTVG